jgi:hypothetical protein
MAKVTEKKKKYRNFMFISVFFSSFFGHQNPGSGSGSKISKNAGSGSALNECGSETPLFREDILNSR